MCVKGGGCFQGSVRPEGVCPEGSVCVRGVSGGVSRGIVSRVVVRPGSLRVQRNVSEGEGVYVSRGCVSKRVCTPSTQRHTPCRQTAVKTLPCPKLRCEW